MLRKIVRVLLVAALIVGAIWLYMRLVVEPCVQDISRYKRQARDLASQLQSLQAAEKIPELDAREKRMLEKSRHRLRSGLTKMSHGTGSWKILAGQIARHAGRRGFRIRALESAPITPAESLRVESGIRGTSKWRITAKIHGSPRLWGSFLKSVARGPAYLTLARFEILGTARNEARIDWIWHSLVPGGEVSPEQGDLIDWEGDMLNQRLPGYSGMGGSGALKNRGE